MVELINGLEGTDTEARNKFSRCVRVKKTTPRRSSMRSR